jgi:hypothetical protein
MLFAIPMSTQSPMHGSPIVPVPRRFPPFLSMELYGSFARG